MKDLFYYDHLTDKSVTYSQLISDINNTHETVFVCKSLDYYHLLKSIIISMLIGRGITLIDGEFTETEVLAMSDAETVKSINKASPVELSPIASMDDLTMRLTNTDSAWRITLFTSGTTGRPKMVSHDKTSINRNVKQSDKHRGDLWGLAYNPTHMAGIQVFLQALFNGNGMVRLFGLDKHVVFKLINEWGVTHLSATPTFYRMLLPSQERCETVTRITSGGERFDSNTAIALKHCFPNAHFTNVYASTEAGALFASQGDVFAIKEGLDGLIKVENNELLINRSLLGQSDSFDLDNGWYRTGDIVEVTNDEPLTFKFVSRKSELINVGGYKVNPTEVEDCIRQHQSVKEVRVYAKTNRIMGNIVCADIVCADGENPDESDIRSFLQSRIQEYKIPRMIRFVQKLDMTKTGKLSRT